MPLAFREGWCNEHPTEYEQLLAARLAFPTPQTTWRAQFAACEDFLFRGGEAPRIDAPTLVIHGTDDRIVPVANGRMLAEVLPYAEFHEIAGAGHVVHLEQPSVITALIAAFIQRVRPPNS